ncbi:copper resistance protein CopC [Micromonospora sp. NPDC048935]|uniref:copper resistance CopC family protein n=1 Tax=Micromonospora sp. NPDC048935 TaxID=3364262 RepID=UPI00371D1F8E
MPRERGPRAGRWGRRAVALLAASSAALLPLPGVAHADNAPVLADPPSGAALTTAPGAVTLRFADDLSGDDSHVTVSDAGGRNVTVGEATQAGPAQMRAPIQPSAQGDLTVAYHVIFRDGDSATGVYRFSVGTGVAPAPLSGVALQEATSAVSRHTHQVDGASAVLLIIDGAVLLAVLFLLWSRPRTGGRASWRYQQE